MFFNEPGAESPDRLDDAKTPNQSLYPVSRHEDQSADQVVDPFLLADKLAEIPEVGSALLAPESESIRNANSRLGASLF